MFKLTVAQSGEVIYVSGLKPRDPATLMDYKGDLSGPEMNKAKQKDKFYVVLLKKHIFLRCIFGVVRLIFDRRVEREYQQSRE